MLREEAVSHPLAKTPEQNYIEKENIRELYNALKKLTAREFEPDSNRECLYVQNVIFPPLFHLFICKPALACIFHNL